MTPTTQQTHGVDELIRRLDEDTRLEGSDAICAAVKKTLCEEIISGRLTLPEPFLVPAPSCYARRLLHKHATDAYAVVIMVWGNGQGTPIHDHSGKWCVECVYKGKIRVSSYELIGAPDDEIVSFRHQEEIEAGIGAAGALIPPYDYHVIRNVEEITAVTVHVYGGEMEGCQIFHEMEDGRHRSEWIALSYS